MLLPVRHIPVVLPIIARKMRKHSYCVNHPKKCTANRYHSGNFWHRPKVSPNHPNHTELQSEHIPKGTLHTMNTWPSIRR